MSYREAEPGWKAETPQTPAFELDSVLEPGPRSPGKERQIPALDSSAASPAVPEWGPGRGWGAGENKQECLGKLLPSPLEPAPPPACSPLPGLSAHTSLQSAPFPSASPSPFQSTDKSGT